MKRSCLLFWIFLFVGFAPAATSLAGESGMEALGRQVVEAALVRLDAGPDTQSLACLTNAGSARHNGKETRILWDAVARHARISIGRGNLLAVHSAATDPLWFAFVHHKGPAQLPLTWVTVNAGQVTASAAVNAYIAKHRSFDDFRSLMGGHAFAVVSLANGWADDMPPDLMAGACFHDHFCCGVASGYFTARFISEHLPLGPGERYAYIGVPAWCQDDYILYHLNLTPGKHGYFTMAYPWSRPWQSAEKRFSDLGGIVVRVNDQTGRGRADLLRFDWRWDDFKRFLEEPEIDLNWKEKPWFHAWYNRYLFQKKASPVQRVSVVKSRELNSRADLEALTRLGANPLAVMLGKDASW